MSTTLYTAFISSAFRGAGVDFLMFHLKKASAVYASGLVGIVIFNIVMLLVT